MATAEVQEIRATSYVGFDSITQQIEHKLLKRGFQFNVIVVGAYRAPLSPPKLASFCGKDISYFDEFWFSGQTGLGKSTLINTIFASHLIDSKGRREADEPVRQTTEIQTVSHGAVISLLLLNVVTLHFCDATHARATTQLSPKTGCDCASTLSIPPVTVTRLTMKTGTSYIHGPVSRERVLTGALLML
jgi:hypothetical protein